MLKILRQNIQLNAVYFIYSYSLELCDVTKPKNYSLLDSWFLAHLNYAQDEL